MLVCKASQTVKYNMALKDTIVPLAHIHVKDTDYNVYISVCTATRHMHIFKYNDLGCEYEIFDSEGGASEFIEKPLKNVSRRR